MISTSVQVDIHAHIVPALDDGPRSVDEALAMLRQAAADGTGVIVATPHASNASRAQVLAGVEKLRELAVGADLSISILAGHEVRMDASIIERLKANQLQTLGDTPYVLVELASFQVWQADLMGIIYEMQSAGIWPILAHAERYHAVQKDPSLLQDLLIRGVPLQINADSLHSRSTRVRNTSEYLIRSRAVHIVASDAHNTRFRPPRIQAAFERIAALVDDAYASWIFNAAVEVVEGRPLLLPDWSDLKPQRHRLLDWMR